MVNKQRLCFIDNIFSIENYNAEGDILAKGFLLRVQSEKATYYASSYFYLSLQQYNKLKERLADKMITHGQWIYAVKYRGKGYEYQKDIGCIAFPYSWEDIEPASEIQNRKDTEIRRIERTFSNMKAVHTECPFSMDGHNSLVVSVLKVGQGDLILIRFPSNRGMIVDAHYSRLIHRDVHSLISEFFGGRAPDTMLITHKHLDHFRYADEIIVKQNIEECWIGVCADHPHSSPTLKRIYSELSRRQIRIVAITENVEFVDGKFIMRILYSAGPKCRYDSDQNKHSIVLDITWRGKRVVLGGDLHNDGWKDLNSQFEDFSERINFLKTPHHCSRTGLDCSIIANTPIEYAVTSCGANRKYKHPHCEPLKSYLANSMHFMTRSTKVPSIDYTLNSKGMSRINLNTFMTAPIDCRYLECFKNCCVKCYRESISKPNSSKTISLSFLNPVYRLKYLL